MLQIVLMVHVLVAVFLILLVLIQQSKSGMGSAFGGGASSTVFGSRGSMSFMMKLTTATVVMFFATSLYLAYLAGHPSIKKEDNSLFGAPTDAANVLVLPKQKAAPVKSAEDKAISDVLKATQKG